jgi:hypothetical protein
MPQNVRDTQSEALERIARTLLIAFLIGAFLGALTASAVIGIWLVE